MDTCGYMWIHGDTCGYMWIHAVASRGGQGGGGGYCPEVRASCGGPGQAEFLLCVDRKSVGDPGGDPGMMCIYV